MKALISPNEVVETGYRVVEIQDKAFEVANPLFWVDCLSEITPTEYFYNQTTQEFVLIPVKQIEQPQAQGVQNL